MERKIAKAIMRQLLGLGVHTSYLSIHAQMHHMGHHVGAQFVGQLLREIELENEAEMWSMLCQP